MRRGRRRAPMVTPCKPGHWPICWYAGADHGYAPYADSLGATLNTPQSAVSLDAMPDATMFLRDQEALSGTISWNSNGDPTLVFGWFDGKRQRRYAFSRQYLSLRPDVAKWSAACLEKSTITRTQAEADRRRGIGGWDGGGAAMEPPRAKFNSPSTPTTTVEIVWMLSSGSSSAGLEGEDCSGAEPGREQ